MSSPFQMMFTALLLAGLSACTVNVFLPPTPSAPASPPAVQPSVSAVVTPPVTPVNPASVAVVDTTGQAPSSPSSASSPSATPNFLPSIAPTRLPFASVAPPTSAEPVAESPAATAAPSATPPTVMFPPKPPIPTLPAPSPSPTVNASPTVPPVPQSYSITFVLTASKGVIFTPRGLTINQGDTVTWKNVYSTAQTLISNDQLFGDQYLSPGASFSYLFTKSGKYSVIVRLGSGSQSIVVK